MLRQGIAVSDLSLPQMPMAALDFEAAGAARGQTDEVVQVGILCANGLDDPTPEQYCALARPEREVAWTAARVHGIRAEHVADAPHFAEMWPDLRQRLSGRLILAHGAETEKRHLRKFPLHGFGPWADTLKLARRMWPTADSHRLGDLCAALGIDADARALCPERTWHDALFDAAACFCLFRRIVAAIREQGADPLAFILHGAIRPCPEDG